jgi:Ca2+-binding RTX toxin-like protein
MERSSTRAALVLALLLVAGCPGGATSAGEPGTDTGSPLAWPDLGSAPLDGAVVPQADLATSADGAPLPLPDGAAGCTFGYLVGTLCRPFAAAQASAAPQDPAGCQDAPKVEGTTGTYLGTDTTRDVVSGLDGDDVIKGLGCSDELHGNQGADELHGNQGNDQLRGGSGKDTIHAGQGHDSIWGGGGDDSIWGGGGDDTFYYSEGNGHDVIQEHSGHDTIACAPNWGMPRARIVSWSRVGDDLFLAMSGNGSVTVKGYFVSPDNSIDMIVGCQ